MNSSLHLLWRERCRLVFDMLWRGDDPLMTRQAAYAWLSNTLGTPDPRLSTLDVEGCVRVMRAAKAVLQTHHRVSAQIDEALASAGIN
jgi:hypothetical protein